MTHPLRSFVAAGSLLLLLATSAAACGSSGGSDASASTTAAMATTTTGSPSTIADETTTTAGGATPTTAPAVDPGTGEVDCQALQEQYAVVFDPNDLGPTVAFFRTYEPSMPDDVSAAVERVAAAYEEAGDLGHMDLASVDLTADSQTFTDWLNDGCPAA